MLDKLIQIRGLQQQLQADHKNGVEQNLDMRSQYFNDVLNRSPGGRASGQQFNGTVTGINAVGTASETAAQKLERLDALIEQANSAQPVQQPVQSSTPLPSDIINGAGHRFGGYLASGGEPRGTDTVNAWLSKGEFVVNERAARTFGSQLQSMNPGARPNFHSHGGSVTNVGDISVHLHGGGSVGTGTGRMIANELRRELRRG